jgi:hypothetical protein
MTFSELRQLSTTEETEETGRLLFPYTDEELRDIGVMVGDNLEN